MSFNIKLLFLQLIALLFASTGLFSLANAQTIRLTPTAAEHASIKKGEVSAKKSLPKDTEAKESTPEEIILQESVQLPKNEPVADGDWLIFDPPANSLLLSRSSVRIFKKALDSQDVYYAYVVKRHNPPIKLPNTKMTAVTQSMGLSFICGYEAMMVVSEEYSSADLSVIKKYRSKDFPLSQQMRAIDSIPGLAKIKMHVCQSKDWPVIEK